MPEEKYTLSAWHGKEFSVEMQIDPSARVGDVRSKIEGALDDEYPILEGMDAAARCGRGPTVAVLTRGDDGQSSLVTVEWLEWMKPSVVAWIESWPL